MKIKIPNRVVAMVDAFMDWGNVPIWTRGRFEFRRIDVIVLIAGIGCVSYYGYFSGWQGALVGGALFILIAMMALWIF